MKRNVLLFASAWVVSSSSSTHTSPRGDVGEDIKKLVPGVPLNVLLLLGKTAKPISTFDSQAEDLLFSPDSQAKIHRALVSHLSDEGLLLPDFPDLGSLQTRLSDIEVTLLDLSEHKSLDGDKQSATDALLKKLMVIKAAEVPSEELNTEVETAIKKTSEDKDLYSYLNNELNRTITEVGDFLPLLFNKLPSFPDRRTNRLALQFLTKQWSIAKSLETANDESDLQAAAAELLELLQYGGAVPAECEKHMNPLQDLMVERVREVLPNGDDTLSLFNDMLAATDRVDEQLKRAESVEDLREVAAEVEALVKEADSRAIIACVQNVLSGRRNLLTRAIENFPMTPGWAEPAQSLSASEVDADIQRRFPNMDLQALAFVGEFGTPIATLREEREKLKKELTIVQDKLKQLPVVSDVKSLFIRGPRYFAMQKLQMKVQQIVNKHRVDEKVESAAVAALSAIPEGDEKKTQFVDFNNKLNDILANPLFKIYENLDEFEAALKARVVDEDGEEEADVIPDLKTLKNLLEEIESKIKNLPSDGLFRITNANSKALEILNTKLTLIKDGKRSSLYKNEEVKNAMQATTYFGGVNGFTKFNAELDQIVEAAGIYLPLLPKAYTPEFKQPEIRDLVQNRVVLRTFSALRPVLKAVDAASEAGATEEAVVEAISLADQYTDLPYRWTGYDGFLWKIIDAIPSPPSSEHTTPAEASAGSPETPIKHLVPVQPNK